VACSSVLVTGASGLLGSNICRLAAAAGRRDGGGTVRVLSKGIGLRADGRPGSVTYRDVVTKSADGWRIAERVAVLRRADRIPESS
jgi:uncharacterized protein YbjT (DUF2867 family)